MEASRYGAVKNDDVKEGTGRRLLHTREFSRGGISQTESRLLSGIRDTVDGEEVIVEKKKREGEGRGGGAAASEAQALLREAGGTDKGREELS
jgi:hypothetical protein